MTGPVRPRAAAGTDRAFHVFEAGVSHKVAALDAMNKMRDIDRLRA